MDSSNQVPDRHQMRADHVVGLARRHAEEIRAAAEQEADRILREAEQEASRRQQERLDAERREQVRFAVQRRQIEGCLDATATTLARIRELVAVLPEIDASTAESLRLPVVAPPATDSADEKPGRSHRLLNSVVIVLATWSVVMVITLIVVSQRSTEVEATSVESAALAPQHDASPARAEIPPRQVPATPPAATDVQHASTTQVPGLTVAFVASRDCWISITSDDGATRDRLLKASERYVVRARDAVAFKAGNAGALSVLINDQPTGPLGAEGQVVTRRITRANYRSFLLS